MTKITAICNQKGGVTKEYRIMLKGALTHEVRLGSDIHGNIARINNILEGFSETLQKCGVSLSNVRTQWEAAQGEVGRPFPQEQDYADKSARLKELDILLNMDQKSRELFDAEPDEADMEPAPRVAAMAR